MRKPQVVALDVIETLFAIEPLSARLSAAGLPQGALRLFFAQMLRDGFVLAAAGAYRPFRELAAGNLKVLMTSHGVPANDEQVQKILAGFAELPAHADVAPAIAELRRGGMRVVMLTNGSADNTGKLLERAGLSQSVERVISIDEVRRWKPHRGVYLHAARVCDVAPERLALVAAHAWDVHGAEQAGLCAAWVKRQDRLYHPAFAPPDVQGDSLPEVAAALLALREE